MWSTDRVVLHRVVVKYGLRDNERPLEVRNMLRAALGRLSSPSHPSGVLVDWERNNGKVASEMAIVIDQM